MYTVFSCTSCLVPVRAEGLLCATAEAPPPAAGKTMCKLVPTVANCASIDTLKSGLFVWDMVSCMEDTARCLRASHQLQLIKSSLFFFVCKCRKSCLPLCTHVSVLKLNYLLQSITYFWLSFPAAWLSQKCPPPPQHLHAVFHTHALRFLATPLEHEIMPLAFIGGPGWLGSLSQCQWDISSFKYRGVSPMASRGLSMPAFPLSSSPSSHDISPPPPGRLGEGRQRSGVVTDTERSGSWSTEGRERGWGFGFSRRWRRRMCLVW